MARRAEAYGPDSEIPGDLARAAELPRSRSRWIIPLGGCHPGAVLLAWYEHQGGATWGALPAGSVTLLRPRKELP
jgi:hypothetical protein